ncbi:hypothetical protein EJ08DRAFT_660578 [Tothia fuscella]|uniref:Uncharacterized protein n=1 Tax=Tothia fuscella TaxID=1048955 RepID=A0A9P4NS04_9PEZI|nr:hypothetical protein EJ08DRAFT_660578 [Tothia fuscella]
MNTVLAPEPQFSSTLSTSSSAPFLFLPPCFCQRKKSRLHPLTFFVYTTPRRSIQTYFHKSYFSKTLLPTEPNALGSTSGNTDSPTGTAKHTQNSRLNDLRQLHINTMNAAIQAITDYQDDHSEQLPMVYDKYNPTSINALLFGPRVAHDMVTNQKTLRLANNALVEKVDELQSCRAVQLYCPARRAIIDKLLRAFLTVFAGSEGCRCLITRLRYFQNIWLFHLSSFSAPASIYNITGLQLHDDVLSEQAAAQHILDTPVPYITYPVLVPSSITAGIYRHRAPQEFILRSLARAYFRHFSRSRVCQFMLIYAQSMLTISQDSLIDSRAPVRLCLVFVDTSCSWRFSEGSRSAECTSTIAQPRHMLFDLPILGEPTTLATSLETAQLSQNSVTDSSTGDVPEDLKDFHIAMSGFQDEPDSASEDIKWLDDGLTLISETQATKAVVVDDKEAADQDMGEDNVDAHMDEEESISDIFNSHEHSFSVHEIAMAQGDASDDLSGDEDMADANLTFDPEGEMELEMIEALNDPSGASPFAQTSHLNNENQDTSMAESNPAAPGVSGFIPPSGIFSFSRPIAAPFTMTPKEPSVSLPLDIATPGFLGIGVSHWNTERFPASNGRTSFDQPTVSLLKSGSTTLPQNRTLAKPVSTVLKPSRYVSLNKNILEFKVADPEMAAWVYFNTWPVPIPSDLWEHIETLVIRYQIPVNGQWFGYKEPFQNPSPELQKHMNAWSGKIMNAYLNGRQNATHHSFTDSTLRYALPKAYENYDIGTIPDNMKHIDVLRLEQAEAHPYPTAGIDHEILEYCDTWQHTVQACTSFVNNAPRFLRIMSNPNRRRCAPPPSAENKHQRDDEENFVAPGKKMRVAQVATQQKSFFDPSSAFRKRGMEDDDSEENATKQAKDCEGKRSVAKIKSHKHNRSGEATVSTKAVASDIAPPKKRKIAPLRYRPDPEIDALFEDSEED